METHILYIVTFLRKSCCFLDNVENYCRAGVVTVTIWRMCIACWIPKATNSNSGYVILIDLSLQQWLHELASMLRNTYIACIFKYCTTYEV
jgi:hypothetical protein